MTDNYFSDREKGPRPRVDQEIRDPAWGGLVALIDGAITSGAFGAAFPSECPDGRGITGTNFQAMGLAVRGEIPELAWPVDPRTTPGTLAVLDFVEFCVARIAKPEPYDFHSFFGHDHLNFDKEAGRAEFRTSVNRIFARNQLAYELTDAGRIVRLAAPVLGETLAAFSIKTGDQKLDDLLATARVKVLAPDPVVRREALEKLWDAFERLKTVEPGADKKTSASALIAKAAPEPTFRSVLSEEAKSLTTAGNTFHIRHSEVSQVELVSDDHVDYLFHRLFALIWLLLRTR